MRTDLNTTHAKLTNRTGGCRNPSGFALIELMISALILLAVSCAVFNALIEMQQAAGYQSEIQSVLSGTQIAMQTVERYVRQAGNDPLRSGVAGIIIVSPQEMRIQSDLTGSAGPGNPDKGDPDGDTGDSGENVTIRYNSGTRSLEIVPDGGPAQIVASGISDLTFTYYNAAGGTAATGSEICKIGISISGTSLLPNPRTRQIFGVKLSSDIQVST
jgi:type II secretory pathway pseudopilin PulG